MRTFRCNEVADDLKLVEKVLRLYETIEDSTTATAFIFRWLPTPSKIRRTDAGGRIYMISNTIVNQRKELEKKVDDPLRFLLDKGGNMQKIISFVIGALFAAQLKSGINAAWILCYLGHYPERKQRALSEVQTVAALYNADTTFPLIDQLTNIPLEAWENDFKFFGTCLRDSIHLQVLGTGFRRNISGKDLHVGNELVPEGTLVVYHLGDIHKDPAVYPDPEQWDPNRHLEENARYMEMPHRFLG